jgi:hypothetical protein
VAVVEQHAPRRRRWRQRAAAAAPLTAATRVIAPRCCAATTDTPWWWATSACPSQSGLNKWSVPGRWQLAVAVALVAGSLIHDILVHHSSQHDRHSIFVTMPPYSDMYRSGRPSPSLR